MWSKYLDFSTHFFTVWINGFIPIWKFISLILESIGSVKKIWHIVQNSRILSSSLFISHRLCAFCFTRIAIFHWVLNQGLSFSGHLDLFWRDVFFLQSQLWPTDSFVSISEPSRREALYCWEQRVFLKPSQSLLLYCQFVHALLETE
jgi:hypothetical protein